MLEQGEMLKDKAHLARLNGPIGGFFTGDPDATAVHVLQASDQAQQCALAGSGGSEQGHKGTALDIETDILDSFEVTEAFADIGDADPHGGCWCRSRWASAAPGGDQAARGSRSVVAGRCRARERFAVKPLGD